MISAVSKGSFKSTEAYLRRIKEVNIQNILRAAGEAGVRALSAATPIDSGLAENSWGFEVVGYRGGAKIVWTNSDIENGFPVAIMIQYGHGTGTGGYVEGRDYINPAMQPIFDQIADKAWRAVISA